MRYPLFWPSFRMYKNLRLYSFIQYFEFGPHTIVFDVPTKLPISIAFGFIMFKCLFR